MDLLTGLIIDGEPDSFASMLYPQARPSWIRALSAEQEKRQWSILKRYLYGNDDQIYKRFFFGDEARKTPNNTAYTIGFHIVQSFLKNHKDMSVLDLLDMDAKAILDGSGYRGQG